MVCNEGEHNFHFIDLESENENYVEDVDGKSICKSRLRTKRYASFICDKCGLFKKVEKVDG